MNASLVSVGAVSSLLIRRLWSIQENVRSTTHRRGRTWKPLAGNSFSQSTSTPSCLHCPAHDFRTSELLLEQACVDVQRGLQSTPRPSLPSLCPSPHPCNQRLTTGVRGAGTTPWNNSLAPSSSSLIPSWSTTFATCTFAFSTRPSVSTSKCRFRPFTFFPPS